MALLGPTSGDDGAMAAAIATAAEERPLVEGPDGARITAALLVAVAWAESGFDQHAVGDGGAACTAWQVHAGSRCAYLVGDIHAAAREARERMRESLYRCRGRELPKRLAAYCSGTCDRGGGAAAYRWALAMRLLRALGFAA
jgi:hypothetical protein